MNNDLLNAATEFNTFFIGRFPNVERPVELISGFNTALNTYAQESSKHGQTINAITVLLSNSALEAFASADSPANDEAGKEGIGKPRSAEAGLRSPDGRINDGVTVDARQVIDGGENLAGLRELVRTLIADLGTSSQP